MARYNTLQQNAQALNVNLANTILARSKPEILRVVELLIDKMQTDISELLVEVRNEITPYVVLLNFLIVGWDIFYAGHGYRFALP